MINPFPLVDYKFIPKDLAYSIYETTLKSSITKKIQAHTVIKVGSKYVLVSDEPWGEHILVVQDNGSSKFLSRKELSKKKFSYPTKAKLLEFLTKVDCLIRDKKFPLVEGYINFGGNNESKR